MLRQTIFISEGQVGLLYADGRYIRPLEPGRYRFWNLSWLPKYAVVRVDTRRQMLTLSGQEMLTADGFTIRITLLAGYRVANPALAMHSDAQYLQTLYAQLQLRLRDAVQVRTLENVLGERTSLPEEILRAARADAETLGVELLTIGVRDVILSAEIRKMLARESEVTRLGKANLASAREEVAATRARANTAKLLTDHPVLLRLRELEAMEKAGEQGNTVIVSLSPSETTALGAVNAAR
jgi:regulator of protease activity HflC (stomatin/prohibitin superfamily)